MVVERLESYYRDLAKKRNEKPHEWRRASSVGRCPRELGYDKLGIKGDPLTPRRMSIFHHGDAIDLALKQDLMQSLDGSIVTENHRGETIIEGVKITGECDGLFYIDNRYGVVDGKTMSDFAFDRACEGKIDEGYQVQGWVYSKIYDVDLVVFYCYRKETSHVVEVIFDALTDATVVTRRYGGNEKEIYINDPMLISEVRTPFSPAIEEKARATVRAVDSCVSMETLPVGVNVVEPETVNVQGAANAAAYANAHGLASSSAVKSGSWFKFHTGRTIAGFPCSYCAHIKRCLGAKLEFTEANKPLWVVNKHDTEGKTDVGCA